MKFAGRLQAAIEVLGDIVSRHRPAADGLKDWGLSHRFAGSGDRAAIGNIVYDSLRWRASSAWTMGVDTPRAWVLATVGRRWGYAVSDIATAIAGDPHAPEPLSPDEVARLDAADLAEAPPHVRADIPEWLTRGFVQTFGEGWVDEGVALAERPPLDLRANLLKADRSKVMKSLARFHPVPTRFAPEGIRIPPTTGDRRHPNLQAEPAFQKGWFEVQDEGSQIAALSVAAKPGEQVLDLCAGAGGKTLALAAAMANRGQIFATDGDRARLAPIFERLRRAGTRDVQVRDAGSSLDDLVGRMDAVLIDAPCSGTGVWRRRPDAKWRLSERAIGDRIAQQTALLASARDIVRPGGRLVYVTCSLLRDENDDRVTEFAAEAQNFAIVPPLEVITALGVGGGLAEAVRITDSGFILSPRLTQTDGFFVAMLRRR